MEQFDQTSEEICKSDDTYDINIITTLPRNIIELDSTECELSQLYDHPIDTDDRTNAPTVQSSHSPKKPFSTKRSIECFLESRGHKKVILSNSVETPLPTTQHPITTTEDPLISHIRELRLTQCKEARKRPYLHLLVNSMCFSNNSDLIRRLKDEFLSVSECDMDFQVPVQPYLAS